MLVRRTLDFIDNRQYNIKSRSGRRSARYQLLGARYWAPMSSTAQKGGLSLLESSFPIDCGRVIYTFHLLANI